MEDGTVGLIEISPARDTLELAPGLASGMTIGADIATPEPAVIRAIGIGTEVRLGVDGALATPREADERRR